MFSSLVIGNLGADAEVINSNGAKFIALSVASTVKRKKDDGTETSETTWIEATINNAEHPILPYLKAGVKVAMYGYTSLRVFSSKKDRCMKAGARLSVLQIELCGGQSEDVPKQLIDPDTAALYDVSKHYWCNAQTKGMKKTDTKELLDTKNNRYMMDANGFVLPIIQEQGDQPQQDNQNSDAK